MLIPSLAPIENFPNEFMAQLFTIVFLVFLVLELRIYTKKFLKRGKPEDKTISILLLVVSLFVILLSFALTYLGIGRISTTISYFGLVVGICGFVLRQSSIFALRKYFTPYVTKQKNQQIIQKGPYKYIRHPAYFGLLIELMAIGLVMSNLLAPILSFALLFPVVLARIKVEEKFMVREFSNQYLSYMKKTKKLIPFVY